MFAFCLAKFGKEVMRLVSTKSSQSLPPGASHQVVSSNSGHPDMSFHHPVKRSLEGEKAQRFNGHACDKTFWPFFGPFRWACPATVHPQGCALLAHIPSAAGCLSPEEVHGGGA